MAPSRLAGAILLGALLYACASRHGSTPAAEEGAEIQPPPDTDYCSGGVVWAHRLLLRERLDRAGIGSFARLPPEQRQVLARLSAPADLSLELLLEGPRLLVSLPEGHPAGPAELLIAEDRGAAILYRRAPRRRLSWPLDRLPDILDDAPAASTRDGLQLETSPIVEAPAQGATPRPAPAHRLPGSSRRLRRVKASIPLQYLPEPGRSRGWSLRLQLEMIHPDGPAGLELQPLLPLTLGLPLLAGQPGDELLEVLLDRPGPIAGWQVTATNESRPARPPLLQATLEPRGSLRLPRVRFCADRPGYRESPPRTASERPGLALRNQAELGGLRSSRPRGALEVRNRSGHAAWVYADGVLLGWVAAGKRLALPGLPEGFYRIYARSPSAVRSWGPYDVYVPGPLTLR